jgi:tetratricopeptide (TPR) repeat protein
MGRTRCVRAAAAAFGVLSLVPGFLPAQGGGLDPDKARRDALSAFAPVSRQELEEARKRWPIYDRAISDAIPRQDGAVAAGGKTLDDAIAFFEQTAHLNGTPVNTYLAGRLLGLSGRLDEARAWFERSVATDKFFYWGYHGLATYFAMKDMHEPAAQQYRRALDYNPEFTKAARGLAMCYMSMGRLDEAEGQFKTLIAADPDDSETRLTYAQMLVRGARYVDAINELRTAEQRLGSNPEVERMLAFCYGRTDQINEAMATYERLLAKDAKDWKASFELGKLHQRRGYNHKAADCFRQVLENLPVTSTMNREALQEVIQDLRTMPAVTETPKNQKSPEEWAQLLLHGQDVDRRRQAARVIASSGFHHPAFTEGMLRALRDKDPTVKTIALRTLAEWFSGTEQLSSSGMTRIVSLLARDQDSRVRGMACHVLGEADHPRCVPPLIERIATERDPYVFQQIHRALNRLTFAYLEVDREGEPDAETMERLAREWRAWYDRNVNTYRRYVDER